MNKGSRHFGNMTRPIIWPPQHLAGHDRHTKPPPIINHPLVIKLTATCANIIAHTTALPRVTCDTTTQETTCNKLHSSNINNYTHQAYTKRNSKRLKLHPARAKDAVAKQYGKKIRRGVLILINVILRICLLKSHSRNFSGCHDNAAGRASDQRWHCG